MLFICRDYLIFIYLLISIKPYIASTLSTKKQLKLSNPGLLILSLLFAPLFVIAQNTASGSAQNISRKFTFSVVPETFQLSVSCDGVQEQASNPLPLMQVANLIKTDSLVSWTIPDKHISVRIEQKENYLNITIKADTVEKFLWPKVSAESYTLPFWEGKYIPANDPSWQSFLKGQTYT